MIKRLVLPVLILIAAVMIFVMVVKNKTDARNEDGSKKVTLVKVINVKLQTESPEITIDGRVEAPRHATLSSALAAEVVGVDVQEGDVVEAGQTLIRLDDTDSQLLVAQRQADIDEIDAQISGENDRYDRDQDLLQQQQKLLVLDEKAVKRAQKLDQTTLTSQSILDGALAAKQRQLVTLKQLQHDLIEHHSRMAQLNATKEQAQTLFKQAQVALNRTVITAPFAGRVAKIDVAVGERVNVGEHLLAIYDLNNLEVRAQIPAPYINQVEQSLTKQPSLHAMAKVNNITMPLTLQRLSGSVRQESGGIDGLFTLNSKQQPFPLGTLVKIHLQLSPQDNVAVLPLTAIYAVDKIYRIHNGTLQSLHIARVGELLLPSGEKEVLVSSPQLHTGDQIVSKQLPNVIEGLRVKVR